MSKPEVVSEQPISMVHLKKELNKIKKRDEELNYRANKTEEYLNQFPLLTQKDNDELCKGLENLGVSRLKDIHITKLVDILPPTPEEVKLILQGYTVSVTNESAQKLADVIKPYAEKAEEARKKHKVIKEEEEKKEEETVAEEVTAEETTEETPQEDVKEEQPEEKKEE